MPKPSIAKEYYDQLVGRSDAFAHMMSWINANPPIVETEWLDFKAGRNLTEEKKKEIWSKALAGFANTQGGVLIWGFDCRKSGDPSVDRVCSASLVEAPDSFASRLMELHHQATESPVLGVDIKVVSDPADPTKGVVICFIPESPFKPHRAEYAHRHYYIRAGDDFVEPSVSLLRSLFVPTSTAELLPFVCAEIYQPNNFTTTRIRFNAYVKNTGLVSVQGALVTLHGKYDGDFLTPQDWRKHDTAMAPISFESPRAIHPGETMQVFCHIPSIVIRQPGEENYRFPGNFAQRYELRVFSHNQTPIKATVVYSENNIVHRKNLPCEIDELR